MARILPRHCSTDLDRDRDLVVASTWTSTSTTTTTTTTTWSSPRFAFQSLDVYVAARELAALVHAARLADAELRNQATRAAKSVFLNLCEGLPSDSGPMRRKHFALANGSLHELVGALRPRLRHRSARTGTRAAGRRRSRSG